MDPFSLATSLTRDGEGEFGWTVPDGWQQGRGAWGGLVVGALLRAVAASEPDANRTLRSLTAQLMAPAPVGPVVVRTRQMRRGSSMSTWSAQATLSSGAMVASLVAIVGQLANGTVTSHLVNWLSPLKERVTVITGERGMLLANTVTSELTFYANGNGEFDWETNTAFGGVLEGDVTRYSFEKTEPLRTEHERFRDAVLGESDHIATADEALEVVRVAAAMLESAQTGETVRILAAE